MALLFLQSVTVFAQTTCPPGDVPLNVCGNVIDKATADPECKEKDKEDEIASCLYGGDIASNKGFGGTITDPRANVRIVLNIIMGFLSIIVVAMVIYGGSLWLTSMGSEEKVEKGKQTILWAAIGAVAISIAWTVASYILSIGSAVGG